MFQTFIVQSLLPWFQEVLGPVQYFLLLFLFIKWIRIVIEGVISYLPLSVVQAKPLTVWRSWQCIKVFFVSIIMLTPFKVCPTIRNTLNMAPLQTIPQNEYVVGSTPVHALQNATLCLWECDFCRAVIRLYYFWLGITQLASEWKNVTEPAPLWTCTNVSPCVCWVHTFRMVFDTISVWQGSI